jgi:hypothetical protein
MMNQFKIETCDCCLNESIGSIDANDLPTQKQRKSYVFVSYGMQSISVPTDGNDSFSEVKKVVEGKTGIPIEEQVLTLNNKDVVVDNEKSLRNYGFMGSAFCSLTRA